MLLFDLDGTLVDSKRDIILCVNRAFSSLGMPTFSDIAVGSGIGNGSEHLFYQLLGQKTPPTVIQQLLGVFGDFYSKHMTENTRPYPGVLEVLAHYSKAPKVIVTNKSQVLADRLIDHLGLRPHFEGVFGYEAFPTRKPDPGPILQVCARWGVAPKLATFVGDSVVDITAGRKAGTRTIAALYGYGDKTAIQNSEPTFTINSAFEMIGLV